MDVQPSVSVDRHRERSSMGGSVNRSLRLAPIAVVAVEELETGAFIE